MAQYARPGVYVSEAFLATPQVAPSNPTEYAFVLCGQVARGPITPTQVNSWSDYVNIFGSFSARTNAQATALPRGTNTMAYAAYSFFASGGTNLYVQRVVPTGAATAATATITKRDGTTAAITFQASSPGVWGNSVSTSGLAIDIVNTSGGTNATANFDVIVYYNVSGTTAQVSDIVERFPSLSLNPLASNYALNVINSNSRWVRVSLVSPSTFTWATAADNPLATTVPATFTGGTESTTAPVLADYTGGASLNGPLYQLDAIQGPIVLNIPGASLTSNSDILNAAAVYLNYRTNGLLVADVGLGLTSAATVTTNATTAMSTIGTNGSLVAAYWPNIKIADPTSAQPGSLITVAPGGAVLGVMSVNDRSRGPWKTPAGLLSQIPVAVDIEVPLLNSDLDTLNSAVNPVNAIRNLPGNGVTVMGGRTLDQSNAARYVNVRRMMSYIKANVNLRTQYALYENNTPALWTQISNSLGAWLNGLWQQGGLLGATPTQAYYVKVDATNNTPATIAAGQVNIEVGVSLANPAEFIIIRVGQIAGSASVIGDSTV